MTRAVTLLALLIMASTSLTPRVPVTFNESIFNPLFFKIRDCQSRFVINKGGAGSGKSFAAAQNEVVKSLQSKEKTLVIRKVGTTLKDSVIPLFTQDIIAAWGLTSDFEFNKSDKELTNKVNGSQFLFRGLDDPEKIKSIQGITRIFIEEMSELEEADFDQLDLRLRGKHSGLQIVGCFNPVSEYSWIKRRFFDNPDPDATIFETTYRDNKYLDEAYIKRLNNLVNTNPLYYQIYVLNEWGVEDKSNKFAYAYDPKIHSVNVTIDPNSYVYFSFDFNVDPITCMVAQEVGDETRVVEMVKLPDSNIYNLCDYLKAGYGNLIPIITGDATGRNTSALVRDKLNYYVVIRDQLNLSEGQIRVPTVNPPLVENKVHVNAVLRNKKVLIDPVNAKALHYDLMYVKVDEDNKMIKSDRNDEKQQADALDCFRYYVNEFHKDVLESYRIKP